MDTLLVALLGIMSGGVVNALADDLPAGRKPSQPRYPDGQDRRPLAWLGLTAFALRLRKAPAAATCPQARRKQEGRNLSWRYPLVEVSLAALMTLTYAVARDARAQDFGETLIWLALVALFVLIAVIDLEHMRIPVSPLVACAMLALLRSLTYPQSSPTVASLLLGALCAGAAFSLVYLGGRFFSLVALRQEQPASAFGRGDVYLMTVGGLILGFPSVLMAMVLTMLLGGLGAVGYLLVKSASGGYRRFSALPYAPYILASIYLFMLLGDELNRRFFGA